MTHCSRARDRRIKPGQFQIEPLEYRLLLSTGSVQELDVTAPSENAADYITATPGEVVTFNLSLVCTTPLGTTAPLPTGTVTLKWNEDAGNTVTIPLSGGSNAGYPGNQATVSAQGTLTLDDTMTQVLQGSGPVVYATYSGDGNYPVWNSLLSGSQYHRSVGVNFQVQSHLAFIQSPSNSAAGDVIKPPVTVAVQDSSGAYQTGSTDSITLSLTGGNGGTGTLGGSTTESAVGGIATFSDLSVSAVGDYTLTATDNTNPSCTSAISTFTIQDNKLVFLAPPITNTNNPGDPLSPAVRVELEDGNNTPVTTSDGSSVTLSLIGLNSANPITGTTAKLSGGIATFSDVVLTKPGSYQLQASDTAGDIVGTSNKFSVGGDTLRFAVQPKNTDPGQPLTVKVLAFTAKGTLDTTLDDTVLLALNTVSGGAGATLAGTTRMAFKGGVALFTPAAKVAVGVPGTYTLTATPTTVDGSGNASTDFGATAATSNTFVIANLKLKVLIQPPASADIAAPFILAIEVVNTKGKVFNENTAQCILSLNVIDGSPGAKLKGTTGVTFTGGIARFTSVADLLINGVGTFTLTASENTDTPATPIDTRSIKVKGYGLSTGFASKYIAINDDLQPETPGTVLILDPSGRHLAVSSASPGDFPNVQLTLTPISGSGTLVNDTPISAVSYPGSPDVDYLVPVNITSPGTYLLTVSPIDTPGSVIPYTAVAASKPYRVEAVNHTLNFKQSVPLVENVSPSFAANAVGERLPGADYSDTGGSSILKLKSSVGFELTLNPIDSTGNLLAQTTATQTGPRTIVFAASTFYSDGDKYIIDAPGRYTMTETEIITPSDQPFDPANFAPETSVGPLTSAPFLVLSDKLAFTQQPPVTLSIGQTFSVQVAIEDNHGNILTDFSPGTDPNFTAAALLSILARISGVGGATALQGADAPANFLNGVATFSNLSFNASGFYALGATEQNTYPESDGIYYPSPVPTVAKSVRIRVLKGT